MLTLEEYIAKRKKEDNLNEFDLEKRIENIKISIDYIFEFYNGYLNITEAEHKTVLNDERLEKFRHRVREYDNEIQDWLVDIFDKYGKFMHKNIGNLLSKNELFLLFCTDSEFRSASYDCYSKLVRKFPFLKDQTEILFSFIKDHHRVISNQKDNFRKTIFPPPEISDWVEKTKSKYQVNIEAFVYSHIIDFEDHPEKWPKSHRKKSDSKYNPYDYDYKQQKNLFNIDMVYPKISNKPFLKGKKQHLEILMMHCWLCYIETDQEYWNEYLAKVSPESHK